MFTEFMNQVQLFAGHWAVVIGVGLAFLFVQMLLSLRLYLRLRRQEKVLARLRRNFEKGGNGRGDERRLQHYFRWIQWVTSIFPRGEPAPPGNITRDDVFRELDVRIAGDSSYLLLQRMGVMAPLLGVVLTVISFYWLEIDEAQIQSLPTILLALTPLVSGVGAGAVLALINQALLHVVGRRIESLRLSAREWFDAVIWTKLPSDVQGTNSNAVAAVERLSRSMSVAADRYTAGAERVDNCTASMMDAAQQLHESVQSFGTEIKGIPAALRDIRNATTASANALRDLIPVNARAVASLDVSVAAFRTTIDREFTAAAKLHQCSSKELSDAVEQIGAAAEGLAEGMTTVNAMLRECSLFLEQARSTREALAGANASLTEVGKQLHGGVNNTAALLPPAAYEAVTSLSDAAARLVDFVEQSLGPAVVHVANLQGKLSALETSGNSIEQVQSALDGTASSDVGSADERTLPESWFSRRPR